MEARPDVGRVLAAEGYEPRPVRALERAGRGLLERHGQAAERDHVRVERVDQTGRTGAERGGAPIHGAASGPIDRVPVEHRPGVGARVGRRDLAEVAGQRAPVDQDVPAAVRATRTREPRVSEREMARERSWACPTASSRLPRAPPVRGERAGPEPRSRAHATAGLAVAGLGAAVLYPVTLAGLIRTPGLGARRGAALGCVASGAAALASPALLRALAAWTGLRTAFAAIVPILLLLGAVDRPVALDYERRAPS